MALISLNELKAAARVLNLSLSDDRLEALLPDVRRLQRQANQLRMLPLEDEEPALRRSLE